jgi:hypothetical protein
VSPPGGLVFLSILCSFGGNGFFVRNSWGSWMTDEAYYTQCAGAKSVSNLFTSTAYNISSANQRRKPLFLKLSEVLPHVSGGCSPARLVVLPSS